MPCDCSQLSAGRSLARAAYWEDITLMGGVTEAGRALIHLGPLDEVKGRTSCGGAELVLLPCVAVTLPCSHICWYKSQRKAIISEEVSPCKCENRRAFRASSMSKMGCPGHTDSHSQ